MEGVDLEIVDVHIYLLGVGSLAIDGWTATKNSDGSYKITFTLDAETAASYDQQIYEANELDKKTGDDAIDHPFTYGSYDDYWNIEVYYTMTLLNGAPSQVIDNTAKNASADAKR